MTKKPVKHSKALIALEVALMGLLCWAVLSSNLTNQPGNTVQAGNSEINAISGQKQRHVPPEGTPRKKSRDIIAQLGTPGACSEFDFQNGAQGFTTQMVSGTQLWHIANGTCRANLAGHTTPFTFYYGQEGTCNYNTGARNAANLISPSISLSGLFPPYTIGFNYLLFVESSSSFDTTFVDLSTDGGATWTPVLSKANMFNDNQWHNIGTDVTAVIGGATSINLRFRFDSVDNLVNSSTGWHVDDVLVCGNPFDVCVQDDTNGNILQFNSQSGNYIFTQCSNGTTITGTGTVTTSGCFITLVHNLASMRLSATVNTCQSTGNATLSMSIPRGVKILTIKDTDTTNNTCTCPL